MSKIFVIGGANVDIYAKSYNDLIIKDSNPSKISFSYGGVARNIVCNLRHLGLDVSFISAFGSDAFGKEMYDGLTKLGVDLSYSIKAIDHTSSIYLAILNKEDMYLGASDMDVLNLLDNNHLAKLNEVINDDDYLIFDTNLKEEVIEYILRNIKGIKVIDAISANKVVKLKNHLAYIDVLKLNLLEAERLVGYKLENQEKVKKAMYFLYNLNIKEIIVTDKDMLYILKDNKINTFKHFSYKDNPVNVTGAGDALLAAYVYGRFNNLSIFETAKKMIGIALLTIDSNFAVADIGVEDIDLMIEKTRVENL